MIEYNCLVKNINKFSVEEYLGEYDANRSLQENGFDSLDFIKLVVELESIYQCVIVDEIYYLNLNMKGEEIYDCLKKSFKE